MNDVLMEVSSGRIRPGAATHLISSSRSKPWNGFFVRESGPVDLHEEGIILLKHAVCLQLKAPAHLEWRADGEYLSKVIEPGRVSICPANKLHSSSFRHNGLHLLVLFEPSFVTTVLENSPLNEPFELSWEFGIESPILRELILQLHAEAITAGSGDSHYAEAIARLLVIHLVRHHSTSPSRPSKRGGLSPVRLKKVVDFIENSVAEEITLQTLAAAVGLSVFHFCRSFRQSTGMSPFQYILKHRVNRARSLLLTPESRIHDVALECGFCDQAHFTRHFKRETGMTPAAFARQFRYHYLDPEPTRSPFLR